MSYTSQGFFVEITCVDKAQRRSKIVYKLQSTTAADAATDSAAFIALFVTVTNAIVAGYHILQKFSNDAFSVPVIGTFNSVKAVVSGTVVGNPTKSVILNIPNPVDGIFAGGAGTPAYNVVDIADSDLSDYAAAFGTGGQVYISDGELLDAMTKGVRVTRSLRNP